MTTDPPPPADFAYFCEVYRDWREFIGVSQDEIARRGGPSDTLQTDMERLSWSSRRPATTLRKVDQGFGWPHGTARDVLHDHFDPMAAGWPARLDPDIEQASKSTSTAEYRLQRWADDARGETSPPSNYLRLFGDQQLLDELGRRLSALADVVDQSMSEGDEDPPALSAVDDNLSDLVAAHEEEGPISGETGHDDHP